MLTIAAEKAVEPAHAQAEPQQQQQPQQAQQQEGASAPASASAGEAGAAPAAASTPAAAPRSGGGAEPTWLRAERSFGRVERSLTLPADADIEAIGAKLENGVLTLTVPRRASHAPPRHSIEIK